MDIAGLSIPYNFTVGSLLHVLPEVTYPGLLILSVGTVAGSLGNLLVILTVLLKKSLKQIGNYFIVNLAIADLCITMVIDPLGIVSIVHGEIYFIERRGVCLFVASLCLVSCYCSLLSIGAIAINRYIHICHSSAYPSIFTHRSTIAMCCLLWLVSGLMEMPNFLGWGDHGYAIKNLACLWDRLASRSYTIFFAVAGVALPCAVIAVCYAKIYVHFRSSKLRLAKSAASGGALQRHHAEATFRLARTLFLVFAVLVVCWAPFTVAVVVDHEDKLPIQLHAYSMLLAHTNSTVNFLVYGLSNREFSSGYASVLKRLWNRLLCSCCCVVNNSWTWKFTSDWHTDGGAIAAAVAADDAADDEEIEAVSMCRQYSRIGDCDTPLDSDPLNSEENL